MTTFHVMAGAEEGVAHPGIRKIAVSDVFNALHLGWADFTAKPSHLVFLCLIYPIAGLVLAAWTSGANMLPILYPLTTGFALVGPIAAIGLYEISKRRERGMDTSWRHAFDVRHSTALPSIIGLGAMLLALFIVWLLVAQALYVQMFGDVPPDSLSAFINGVISTEAGWNLILVGNAVGFVFAVIVLATTVVAFPLLLDRDVGAVSAIRTSVRATLVNPVPVAVWGLIVAAGLAIGTLTLFVGMALVMPVLGHATWHLYRRLIEQPKRTQMS
ncbi:DUF2189 domain-containing protein [Pararhizobium sp.]|uniref:DUF2189 domain-containing protein n=1 Tax=Pararhizobium sp. TaxID=1977563 RepID=UPI0027196E9E|nr:DUF2189 domain-containing protein [Pararhizobium sp.]MDO9417130.1 DUF2189 domain-containing protein [Pararhizobium sp.]